jgi:hypothetical protein
LKFKTRLVVTVLEVTGQALEPSARTCQNSDDMSETHKEDQNVRKDKLCLGIEASLATLSAWRIGELVRPPRLGDGIGRRWCCRVGL